VPSFEANAIDLLYTPPDGCDGPQCAPAVTLTYADGSTETLPSAQSSAALDNFQQVRLLMSSARTPLTIQLDTSAPVRVRAISLVDTRTGDFAQATLGSWQRTLSSDIKLYRNLDTLPRAFVVQNVKMMPDNDIGTEGSLAVMRDSSFDPAAMVVLYGDSAPHVGANGPFAPASATITAYSAERVAVHVESPAEGFLVLTDAYYPGWRVTVNGAAAELRRADAMFRAVQIPAGASDVVFQYQPAWWPWAGLVGALAWLGAIGVLAVVRRR
jgi:membrane protein YfhO